MTPTGRTLGYLRRLGFVAAVVESWIPHIDRRRDLWGFADVLAVHPKDRVFLLVQVTTIGHVAHRLAKAKGKPELALWLKAGGVFEVHGWTCPAGRWQVKRVAVELGDLPEELRDVTVLAPRRRRPCRYVQGDLFAAVDVPAAPAGQ